MLKRSSSSRIDRGRDSEGRGAERGRVAFDVGPLRVRALLEAVCIGVLVRSQPCCQILATVELCCGGFYTLLATFELLVAVSFVQARIVGWRTAKMWTVVEFRARFVCVDGFSSASCSLV